MDTKFNEMEMNDTQIDEVVSTLKENISDDVKNLREINNTAYPTNVINREDLVEGKVGVIIDPNTGEHKMTPVADVTVTRADVNISDISEETQDTLTEKALKEAAPEMFADLGLTEKESLDMVQLILKFRDNNKMSVYNLMPEPVKKMVRGFAGSSNLVTIQTTAKDVLSMFVNNMQLDKEIVDLQTSLKKELQMDEIADMYDEHLKTTMSVDLIRKAEALEATGDATAIEKAKTLRDISAMYKEASTFSIMKKALVENEPASKRLDKEVKKLKNLCRDFNYKYNNSKFTVKDVSLMITTLGRVLPERITSDETLKFVALFCKTTVNMKPSNILEHVYMYYTIQTVLCLDFIKIDSEFYTEAVNNIVEVIELIQKKETENNGK